MISYSNGIGYGTSERIPEYEAADLTVPAISEPENQSVSPHVSRFKRAIAGVVLVASGFTGCTWYPPATQEEIEKVYGERGNTYVKVYTYEQLDSTLDKLPVEWIDENTGYSRSQFGSGWREVNETNCDTRESILRRDLVNEVVDPRTCEVLKGDLYDTYTGKHIPFVKGKDTSDDVQIDHRVSLHNAWLTGFRKRWLTARTAEEVRRNRYERIRFANDPLNLEAVDGPANEDKGDDDAYEWPVPNRAYRCSLAGAQILVKDAYDLWVTPPERSALEDILLSCRGKKIPIIQ